MVQERVKTRQKRSVPCRRGKGKNPTVREVQNRTIVKTLPGNRGRSSSWMRLKRVGKKKKKLSVPQRHNVSERT